MYVTLCQLTLSKNLVGIHTGKNTWGTLLKFFIIITKLILRCLNAIELYNAYYRTF